jgi:hypothetical protein
MYTDTFFRYFCFDTSLILFLLRFSMCLLKEVELEAIKSF